MATESLYICINQGIYHPFEILTILVSLFAIGITILIMIHASIQFPKQTKMSFTFKCSFWISCGFVLVTLTTACTATILCVEGMQKAASISMVLMLTAYFCLLLTLLTTLLLRLRSTFDGSVYEVSKNNRFVMVTLYILTVLAIATSVTLFIIILYCDNNNLSCNISRSWVTGCISIACLGGFLYICTACYATFIFVNNMMVITKSGATSQRMIAPNGINNSTIQLNEAQNKLIRCTVRYVSLFFVATITSFMAVIILANNRNWNEDRKGFNDQVFNLLSSIDAITNLICLYLQYQYNAKYYVKYCHCLGDCWKSYFTRKVKSSMSTRRKLRNVKEYTKVQPDEASGEEN
eukprot:75238_1